MEILKTRLLLLLMAGLLAACSSVSQQPDQVSTEAGRLVSLDLVNVLNQVQSLNPSSTILLLPQAEAKNDQFVQDLLQALQGAGYAISITGNNDQAQEVSYAISRQPDFGEVVLNYTVNVGEVSVRRAYKPEVDGWISPVAAVQIRGADASQILPNDDVFQRSADEPRAATDLAERMDLPVSETGNPTAEPETPQVPAIGIAQVEIIAPATLGRPASAASGTAFANRQPQSPASISILPLRERAPLKPRQPLLDIIAPTTPRADTVPNEFGRVSDLKLQNMANVRDLGKSNYADILNDLGTVNETILTFSNDSTRLGETNKERVRQFVAQFDPQSDVFSVIGCSNGVTNVEGGQEALALGRALRVKEELRFAGIPEDKIMDEGCWAPEQFDERMPRRGVVLTLKRRS